MLTLVRPSFQPPCRRGRSRPCQRFGPSGPDAPMLCPKTASAVYRSGASSPGEPSAWLWGRLPRRALARKEPATNLIHGESAGWLRLESGSPRFSAANRAADRETPKSAGKADEPTLTAKAKTP